MKFVDEEYPFLDEDLKKKGPQRFFGNFLSEQGDPVHDEARQLDLDMGGGPDSLKQKVISHELPPVISLEQMTRFAELKYKFYEKWDSCPDSMVFYDHFFDLFKEMARDRKMKVTEFAKYLLYHILFGSTPKMDLIEAFDMPDGAIESLILKIIEE